MRLTPSSAFAAGRGRGRTAAKKPPHPEGIVEEAGEQAVKRSHSPEADAGRADASVPMDVETGSGVQAEDRDMADAKHTERSAAAEGPTTLLEELLSLPTLEYDGLVANPTEGAYPCKVKFKLSRDGVHMQVRHVL